MSGLISGLAARLKSAGGAGIIAFLQAAPGAIVRSIADSFYDRVCVFEFMTAAQIADVRGRAGDLDVTAALQAARDYIAETRKKLIFPAGLYCYSKSPNWAIHHAEIEFEGEVTLRYTGAGNAVIVDAGAADAVTHIAGLCYGVKFGWGTRPTVEAPATAGNGFYVRSAHHCKIGGRVRGCGNASSGLRVEFAVCSEFDVVVSGNQDAWYQNAKPLYGYFLSERNAGETTSYCTFVNPVVEGLSIGVYLHATLGNCFFGGTSEACAQYGVYAHTTAAQDKFYGTDFEVNGIADIYDMGTGLVLADCDTYTKLTLGGQSRSATVRGGRHSKIVADVGCARATFRDLTFNRFSDGGTFDDSGADTCISNVSNSGAGWMKGKLDTQAVVLPEFSQGVNAVTVPGAKVGDLVTWSFSKPLDAGLSCWAQVTAPNTVSIIVNNNTDSGRPVPAGTYRAAAARP
jgi:hypothetical protein